MASYNFITVWKINAPLPEVWELIKDARRWSEWWRGVLEVRELKKGNDDDHGTLFAHTWRSILPYRLKFVTEITKVALHKSIEAGVNGELEGTGRWEFKDESNGWTTVTYFWNVRTTMFWMNITAPLLSGMFKWNHNAVMRWGGEGVAKKLKCEVEFVRHGF